MKQEGLVKLEAEKNERSYSFIMPLGAPYGEAYDILFEMMQEIVDLSKKAADKLKREEEVKTEEEKEEESN